MSEEIRLALRTPADSLQSISNRRIFRYFKTSTEIIRLAVRMYVRYPLSLRNVEVLLHERVIDITHQTVRFWWNRFGTIFAAEVRRNRVKAMRCFQHRHWHLDEVFVKINGEKNYLWWALDHEGEVLESFVTMTRDRKAALKFLRKSLRQHGSVEEIITDSLASYGAAMEKLGNHDRRRTGRYLSIGVQNRL
jgi:putative transposase